MEHQGPIFLVGFMGAGKTTIGRMLAQATNRIFIDLDDLIEARTGKAIPVIFETDGEQVFRLEEHSALTSLKGKENLIVSTGGGCPAFFDNMEWMIQHGTTIYLRCHPGCLFHRIAPEKSRRPLIAALEDVAIMEYILETIRKRLPFYTQSTITVNGENAPTKVLEDILLKLRE